MTLQPTDAKFIADCLEMAGHELMKTAKGAEEDCRPMAALLMRTYADRANRLVYVLRRG